MWFLKKLLELVNRYRSEKYLISLSEKCVMGDQFCSSPIYRNRLMHIFRNVIINNSFSKEMVVFGDYNNLSLKINLRERGTVRTGDYVYTNSNVKFDISHDLVIGNNCLFGPGVTIWDSDNHSLNPKHRIKDAQRLAVGPLNQSKQFGGNITIGDNVWIGMDALVLGGVQIGNNSVVAARSVVTRDVPANTLVAGAPAKVIKRL